jgi:hypothetical protein
MSEGGAEPRGLAADCTIETAEGPVPISEAPGKGFAVLTRLASGQLGFRQYLKLAAREGVPLVRLVLDSGHAVVAATGHPFYRQGGGPVAAAALGPGDLLETAFQYPDGYVPPDATGMRPHRAIAVARVEPAGTGRVFTGTVRDTHALFLTAGVLCAE